MSAGDLATKRILVVDDNEDNRQILIDLLSGAGYEVIEARTGLDAVATAGRDTPHLVLMDIQLPGIDGLEATRRIKAQPALARIPIIAVTSYALAGDDRKAAAAGCDGYVTKPYSPRALLAQVRTILGDTPPPA
jgi:two-component system cell cycle response regulator DivK